MKILLSMLYKGDILSMRSRILFDICENLRTNSVFSVSILCWFDRFDAQKFFFPFPFIADLIEVRDKSFFFRFQSLLIWSPWRTNFFFSVSNHCWFDCLDAQKYFFSPPIFPDLIAICKKSGFFRFQSLLIWLPWGRKVFFSVSFCCWCLQLLDAIYLNIQKLVFFNIIFL